MELPDPGHIHNRADIQQHRRPSEYAAYKPEHVFLILAEIPASLLQRHIPVLAGGPAENYKRQIRRCSRFPNGLFI